MSKLVAPHGGKGLVCCLLHGNELEAENEKAAGLKKVQVSDRAKGDLIMMGIGGFSPLDGFMTKADWKGVCEKFQMADGTFWPVPITLDISSADAADVNVGDEVALERDGEIYAIGDAAAADTQATAQALETAWDSYFDDINQWVVAIVTIHVPYSIPPVKRYLPSTDQIKDKLGL